jgi:hypothetical protein
MDAKPPVRLQWDDGKHSGTDSKGYVIVGKQLIRADRAIRSTTPLPYTEIINLIRTYDPGSEPPPCDCFAEPEILIMLLDAHDALIATVELDTHGYMNIQGVSPGWRWGWYGMPESLSEMVTKNAEKYRAPSPDR